MTRIPSGSTDRFLYFVAVDPTDLQTRKAGLTGFTVYRSRNGGAATLWDTPTINETSSANMPGVYELQIDEDTTLTAGNDTEEVCMHITHGSMEPVTRVYELYRPETTEGNTLDVTSTGAAGIDWANIENPTTPQNLSATNIDTDQVVASVSGAVGSVTNDVGVNEWNGVLLATTNPLPNAGAGAAGGLPTDSTGKTSFNDITTAQVSTQIEDSLNVDTRTLPAQEAPPPTPTIVEMLTWAYKVFRNKKDQSATDWQLYDNAGSQVDAQTTLTESAGVVTKNQIGSGP